MNSVTKSLAQIAMEFEGYEARPDGGSSTDGGIGVTANKPNYPRTRTRSEAIPIEHEDE